MTWRALVLSGLMAVCAWLASGPAAAVHAADPITVQVTGIQNNFPKELVFNAEAASTGGEIKSVRFHMTTGRDLVEKADSFALTPGAKTTATYTLKTAGNNFIPAGTTMTWWVEVQDAAGNVMSTPKQQYWYADTRFQWSKLQDGQVTLYYYGGAEQAARAVMEAAKEVQGNTGALLGVNGNPFTLMLYNTPRDIIGAQREETSATTAQNLIKVGIAYPGQDLVQVLGGGSSFGGPETTRHETTHLFEHWAAGDRLPTWLDEGLAVWSQKDPGGEYTGRLKTAIQNDTLLLVRGMESFPGKPDDVLLAYGQSWSLVKYLIDTYGKDKYRQLYETLVKEGSENALKSVYGVTYDELDSKWRQSVGAKPRSFGSARPTPLPVFGGGEPDAGRNGAPAAGAPGQSGPSPAVFVVAGVVVLLVVGAGVFVATRRKSA